MYHVDLWNLIQRKSLKAIISYIQHEQFMQS